MATKAIAIIPAEEMNVTLSEGAMYAYKFALANAGIEMDEGAVADFIAQRNILSRQFRELWEAKTMLEKIVASIKEVTKHTYNVGDIDDIPAEDGVKIAWSKQSYTYEWQVDNCGADVAQALVQKGLCKVDDILNAVPVNVMAKAAGLTQDKFMEIFPQFVCAKAKERTLSIK